MKKTWRIAPALTLATTLHAMVLTGVVQWRGDAGGADGHAPTHAASLSTRVISGAPPLPAPMPRQVPEPAPEQASAQEPAPAMASADTEDTPAIPPQLTAHEPSRPTEKQAPAEVEAPSPAIAFAMAPVDGDAATANNAPDQDPDRYHARRELSRPPKPLSPIDIVFPPGVPTPGRHTAVLAVYIDELGHVRKVRTEGEALPLAFEDAARNAFLGASFRAGELEGRAVKSYIHVEVVFDEQPQARGLAVSSLGRDTR